MFYLLMFYPIGPVVFLIGAIIAIIGMATKKTSVRNAGLTVAIIGLLLVVATGIANSILWSYIDL